MEFYFLLKEFQNTVSSRMLFQYLLVFCELFLLAFSPLYFVVNGFMRKPGAVAAILFSVVSFAFNFIASFITWNLFSKKETTVCDDTGDHISQMLLELVEDEPPRSLVYVGIFSTYLMVGALLIATVQHIRYFIRAVVYVVFRGDVPDDHIHSHLVTAVLVGFCFILLCVLRNKGKITVMAGIILASLAAIFLSTLFLFYFNFYTSFSSLLSSIPFKPDENASRSSIWACLCSTLAVSQIYTFIPEKLSGFTSNARSRVFLFLSLAYSIFMAFFLLVGLYDAISFHNAAKRIAPFFFDHSDEMNFMLVFFTLFDNKTIGTFITGNIAYIIQTFGSACFLFCRIHSGANKIRGDTVLRKGLFPVLTIAILYFFPLYEEAARYFLFSVSTLVRTCYSLFLVYWYLKRKRWEKKGLETSLCFMHIGISIFLIVGFILALPSLTPSFFSAQYSIIGSNTDSRLHNHSTAY